MSRSKLCWPGAFLPTLSRKKKKAREKDGWCVFRRCGRAAEESEKVTGRPFPELPPPQGSRVCCICCERCRRRGSCLRCCESVVGPPLRGLLRSSRPPPSVVRSLRFSAVTRRRDTRGRHVASLGFSQTRNNEKEASPVYSLGRRRRRSRTGY